MITIIAEKPSVAREIAVLLGATEKKDGYLTGNGYFVTWAFGHLVELAMPSDYGISGFQKSALPIIPQPFLLTIRKIKNNKGYAADEGAQKQLKIIKHVIDQSEKIIAATDAGREGELIFRNIYEFLKCRKPVERLWISSLTEKAIKDGFENLKPSSDFEGLYKAARSRSRADWLLGINASQALSIAAGDGIYSLGRVQTPTLGLICRRYFENKSFSIKQYWQLELVHSKEFSDFKSLSQNKWEDKKAADKVLQLITRDGSTAIVTSAEIKNIVEHPPLLFDLTGLQKEANTKLNLSAEETLTIAQILYEKKFITYPRTGSKFIPDDLWAEIPRLIRVLQGCDLFKQAVAKVKWGHLNKRIVNDLRVTDHHGLLTTEKVPSALTAKENAVYNMIAFRMLEAISQPCIKEVTHSILQALHYDFNLKGSRIIESGWRTIKGTFYDNDPQQELPELKMGDELKIKSVYVLEKKTSPPALYTEAGLLSAMETVGREIEIKEECKPVKNIGIGTAATRSGIIETLFSRNYMQREGKSLLPTSKGLKVYELVKDKKIADAGMTAQWEASLEKIENSEADEVVFQNDIETYTASITAELLQTSIVETKLPQLLCPKCKTQHLLIGDKIVKCKDEICNWIQFRNICGVHLSLSEIENLVNKGKTSLIKGMKSKSGKKFDAYITLNEQAGSDFEFGTRKNRN
ncbi:MULTISPECIES: type IA DNA topoisomerase [unclassified Flavobacterium]|uniref:type IA DNA topoisomerase n=1 Tax=unclassified Flavobacterium TaxID=196869 RepID=UPI0006ABD3D4|nr:MULTISPECIES: type IA DNA topoisomerase [unclassified Flavobacterium]KOP39016.1 DNA topoisomerase I [Flavobacterium sp. VMW]OWU92912.1 DNA topoisomerase III [Flavobacterium sp. NLM]